jgi:hypothetical protein
MEVKITKPSAVKIIASYHLIYREGISNSNPLHSKLNSLNKQPTKNQQGIGRGVTSVHHKNNLVTKRSTEPDRLFVYTT